MSRDQVDAEALFKADGARHTATGSDPNNGVRLQHWGLAPLLVPGTISCRLIGPDPNPLDLIMPRSMEDHGLAD